MGIHDQSWNEPIKNQMTESSVPEVLLGRTTHRIKKRDEKMVSQKLRTALGCYWKKVYEKEGREGKEESLFSFHSFFALPF